ncbi:MAG: SDR family NAD(P)-dependent oxidoreductase [Chloroflexota bacterium]
MAIQDIFALNGKVALITGASRGIGETLAQALGEAGADVAVASRSLDQSRLVADRIASLGRRGKAFHVDVTNVESIHNLVDKVVAEYGRIDVLVNNAGLNVLKPALDVTEEDWDRVLDTNLKGTFFCSQVVGRVMIGQGYGRIVNMASQMAAVGFLDRVAYCASKGGVSQITKVLAVEWARKGVTVNAIAPTFIETAMTAKVLADEEFRQEVLRRIPMGRIGTPNELVGALLYLASDASSLVTGTTLFVDGGWTAW